MLPILLNTQQHVKKEKQVNEQVFEYPSTRAPNKEDRLPPPDKSRGLPQVEFCELGGIVEVRHVCMPPLNSATLFRYQVTLDGGFLEVLADEGRTGYA
jgi:hypothetical protein